MSVVITRDVVLHVSKLASLALDDAEVDVLTRDLEAIVRYVEQLESVDTEGVAPMIRAEGARSALRPDVTEPCLSHEDALSQAPRVSDGGFVVPKFVEPE